MTSQQPNHPHEPPTQGTQSSPVPLSTTSAHQAGERAPALAPGTRIIVFTALLLPAAVLPLLVLRRSVTSLHRKIDALATTTGGLQHELSSTLLELSVRKEQHEQLRAVLDETRASLAALRGETQRAQVVRATGEREVRDRIQELVVSNRMQTARLRELGTSLADVAAFMQEIELQQGFFTPKVDGRGIERLRFLAMQFEGMGKAASEDSHTNASSDKAQPSPRSGTGAEN